MTREEAIRKLEYSKKAYQMLIDEKVDSGKLVGKDVKGEWEADTPLDEAYKSMIDALEIAIKALEQELCDDWYDVPSDEMTLDQARQAVKDLRKKLAEHLVQEPCEDAISRQEAVEAFQMFREYESNRSSGEWVDRIETVLNQLPPVKPKPRALDRF